MCARERERKKRERDNNSALAWRNYPLSWACKTVTSLNQPSTPRYWKPDPCANAGGTMMLSTHWGSDFWGPCSTRGKVCSWLLGALFRCKVQPLGFLGLCGSEVDLVSLLPPASSPCPGFICTESRGQNCHVSSLTRGEWGNSWAVHTNHGA